MVNVLLNRKICKKTTKPPGLLGCIKENLMQIKISDIEKKKNQIYLAYTSSLGCRSLFHNIGCSFYLPREIIKSEDVFLFSSDEQELIFACNAFNQTIQFRNRITQYKVSKIILGENICIHVYNSKNPFSFHKFEFNERKLSGLLNKYRSRSEVRKLIKDVFTLT